MAAKKTKKKARKKTSKKATSKPEKSLAQQAREMHKNNPKMTKTAIAEKLGCSPSNVIQAIEGGAKRKANKNQSSKVGAGRPSKTKASPVASQANLHERIEKMVEDYRAELWAKAGKALEA